MHSNLENNMVCLVDSLEYLKDDKKQQVQALEHLSEMCLQDNGAELFVKTKGMSLVKKLLLDKNSHESVVQKCLLTLGNASLVNVVNKQHLCCDDIFNKIRSLLDHKEKKNSIASASYFLSCICSNYKKAQVKARLSKCLDNLVRLYRKFHPNGDSCDVLDDQWFEKANSSSIPPVMINHISCALKAMMNKPKNVENQMICSRLLNLSISTLCAKSFGSKAKIEALQFIADTVFDNAEAQQIFCMVGGIQYVTRCVEDELSEVVENSVPNVEVLLAAWDTLGIAVSENKDAKAKAAETGIITPLIKCLKMNMADSALLKCLMCVSDLVHESECCQQKVVASDGVPVIIEVMSKNQNEMISKIGTSILQSCVAQAKEAEPPVTVVEENSSNKENEGEGQPGDLSQLLKYFISKPPTAKTHRNKKLNSIKNIISSLDLNTMDSETSQRIQEFIHHVESNSNNGAPVPKKNSVEERVSVVPTADKSTNEMMSLLREQKQLIKDFRTDVSVLRSEMHSRTTTECGDSVTSRNTAHHHHHQSQRKSFISTSSSHAPPQRSAPHSPTRSVASKQGVEFVDPNHIVLSTEPFLNNFYKAPLSKEALNNIEMQRTTLDNNTSRRHQSNTHAQDMNVVPVLDRRMDLDVSSHTRTSSMRNAHAPPPPLDIRPMNDARRNSCSASVTNQSERNSTVVSHHRSSRKSHQVVPSMIDERGHHRPSSEDEKRPSREHHRVHNNRPESRMGSTRESRHLSALAVAQDSRGARPTPTDMKEANAFEKVEQWRQSHLEERSELSSNQINVDLPRDYSKSNSRSHISSQHEVPCSRTEDIHLDETPACDDLLNEKYMDKLQFAPKKPLATKRRRPISPEQDFARDRTPEIGMRSWDCTKRVLDFEGQVINDENRVVPNHRDRDNGVSFDRTADASMNYLSESLNVYQKNSRKCDNNNVAILDTCLGCYYKHERQSYDSRNILRVLLKDKNACDFHRRFAEKCRSWMKLDDDDDDDDVVSENNPNDGDNHSVVTEISSSHFSSIVRKIKYQSPARRRYNSTSHRSTSELPTVQEDVKQDIRASDQVSEYSSVSSTTTSQKRRQRQNYTDEEIEYIKEGLSRFGTSWTLILNSYPFKDGRLAVDLAWKYKQLKKEKKIQDFNQTLNVDNTRLPKRTFREFQDGNPVMMTH